MSNVMSQNGAHMASLLFISFRWHDVASVFISTRTVASMEDINEDIDKFSLYFATPTHDEYI